MNTETSDSWYSCAGITSLTTYVDECLERHLLKLWERGGCESENKAFEDYFYGPHGIGLHKVNTNNSNSLDAETLYESPILTVTALLDGRSIIVNVKDDVTREPITIDLDSLAGMWLDEERSTLYLLESSKDGEFCTLSYIEYVNGADKWELKGGLGTLVLLNSKLNHGVATERSNKLVNDRLIWLNLETKTYVSGPKARNGFWFVLKGRSDSPWCLVSEKTHAEERLYATSIIEHTLLDLPSVMTRMIFADIIISEGKNPGVVSVNPRADDSSMLEITYSEVGSGRTQNWCLNIREYSEHTIFLTEVNVLNSNIWLTFNEGLILKLSINPSADCYSVEGYLSDAGMRFMVKTAIDGESSVLALPLTQLNGRRVYNIESLNEITNDGANTRNAGVSTKVTSPQLLTVISSDGELIPASFYRGKDHDRYRRAVILSYGVYGESISGFEGVKELESFLEAGISLLIPQIRGGGERGSGWHTKGIGANKTNSVNDLVACARYLTDSKLCLNGNVGIMSVSAGAAIAACAVTKAPLFFGAAVLVRPFLDVLGGLLDPNNRLTETDWSEWGNPNDNKIVRDAVMDVSPLAQMSHTCPTLLFANTRDPRVKFTDALAYVIKARELNPTVPILLSASESTKHEASSDNDEQVKQLGEAISWFTTHLGNARRREG